MKHLTLFLRATALSVLSLSHLQAVVSAKGSSSTAGVTFTVAAQCQEYHTPTQTWYLGLTDSNEAETIQDYSLCKASHDHVNQVPTFSAIGSNAAISGKHIGSLSLSTQSDNPTQPMVAFLAETAADTASTTFKTVDYAGNNYVASAALKDSAAETTGKILKVVATPDFVIAAVKANGEDTSNFGDIPGDGLTLTRINRTTTTPTFTYYDATAGTTVTPKALAINATAAGAVFGVTSNSTATDFYDMVYCDDLKRVYVSAQMTAGNVGATDSAFGVAIIKVDDTNNILSVLPQCANRSTVINNNTRVVAFRSQTGVIALRKLRIMKTSSGFYYLIVNGSASTTENTRNGVYAVALVSGNGTDIDGTFAKNDDLTTTAFTTQATNAGDIPASTAAQTQIGGGALPITEATSTIYVSDMKVHGDTVYVAVSSTTTGATDHPGIYYSQAVLNNVGKIAYWTDWAKAAPEQLGNTAAIAGVGTGSAQFIAVDATTADIWATETDGMTVKKTEWTRTGAATTSLIAKLNSSLSSGCFSVYDLNQSVQNIGTQTVYRYALFGGRGKVVFAKTSTATATGYFSPQTVTTDFSLVTNYLETTISGDTAPVTALGYSQGATAAANGYFFAGTKNGLYAFATGGAGFDGANLAHLNAAPFSTYAWQAVTAISGEVRKIVSTHNAVYVLTRDIAPTGTTIQDKVYSIVPNTTIGTFTVRTLATSGTAPGLTTATLFFDIGVMIGANNTNDDKLLLATNDGIYKSAVAVEADTNQTDATWTQVTDPTTDEIIYDLIAQPSHLRSKIMAWVNSWTDSNAGDGTFTRSSITQITSNDTTTVADIPSGQFNSTDSTVIHSLTPIKSLWSDGCRRVWVGIPDNSNGMTNALYAQPYRIGSSDWNITSQQGPLTDTTLESQDRYYWVQAIGATGTLFAGGNKGVACLE